MGSSKSHPAPQPQPQPQPQLVAKTVRVRTVQTQELENPLRNFYWSFRNFNPPSQPQPRSQPPPPRARAAQTQELENPRRDFNCEHPPPPPTSRSQPQPSRAAQTQELEKPWRDFNWKQKTALKTNLENFSLDYPNVKDIKIIVAGQIAAGKSSFINSLDSVFQGRICSRALVNSSAGASHSFTQRLKGFPLRSGGKNLPFIFKDIMGLEPDALAGSQAEDIISVVFGHVKDGYKFNQDQALAYQHYEQNEHYTSEPSLSDQAFCLVYVIDGSTVNFTDEKLIDKLKIIRQRISDRGIPQVVVMTKVDEACPLVSKNLRKVYSSKKIKEKMDLCSAKVGVPMCNIFPVKNYHDEVDTNDDVDVLLLKALDQIVNLAYDRMLDEA